MDAFIPMLGASGAVFGILLAYGMTFPNAIILFMFIIPHEGQVLRDPAGLIELCPFPGGGNVAHLAHLGGMLGGFIFLRMTIPSLGGGIGIGPAGGSGGTWAAPGNAIRPSARCGSCGPKKAGGGNGRTERSGAKSPDQQRIDVILDKISREGLQSLTDEEQEILRRAGRK